jgi:site-specific recombinase XerD
VSSYSQNSSSINSSSLGVRRIVLDVRKASFSELHLVPNIELCPLKYLFEKYLENFEAVDGSTRKAKSYDFKELLLFIGRGDDNRPTLREFTKGRVDAFRDHRADMGESFSTINRRIATFKHFSRVLAERLPNFYNDIQYVKKFDLPETESKVLADDERERILAHAGIGQSEFSRTRNRALIYILNATGLRAEEFLLINLGHIDGRWLKQIKTKGHKVRNQYLAKSVDEALADYLIERSKELNRRCPGHLYLSDLEKSKFPLFVTFHLANINDPNSFRMSYESLRDLVYRVGDAANVKGLHPHRFRHDVVTRLRRKDPFGAAGAAGLTVQMVNRYGKASSDEIADLYEATNKKDRA